LGCYFSISYAISEGKHLRLEKLAAEGCYMFPFPTFFLAVGNLFVSLSFSLLLLFENRYGARELWPSSRILSYLGWPCVGSWVYNGIYSVCWFMDKYVNYNCINIISNESTYCPSMVHHIISNDATLVNINILRIYIYIYIIYIYIIYIYLYIIFIYYI
jgi:hypothetical protein